MAEAGGLVTVEDLAKYRTSWESPVSMMAREDDISSWIKGES